MLAVSEQPETVGFGVPQLPCGMGNPACRRLLRRKSAITGSAAATPGSSRSFLTSSSSRFIAVSISPFASASPNASLLNNLVIPDLTCPSDPDAGLMDNYRGHPTARTNPLLQSGPGGNAVAGRVVCSLRRPAVDERLPHPGRSAHPNAGVTMQLFWSIGRTR